MRGQFRGGTSQPFHATLVATDASCLRDGVALAASSQPDNRGATRKSSKRAKTTQDTCAVVTDTPPVILPWIAFGTYLLKESNAEKAVLDAIRAGYRCIDTAYIYNNGKVEKAVGRAIQKALSTGLVASRKELFIITKQWRKFHGHDDTIKCFQTSLRRLQLDYIDCYLIHWPGPAHRTMNRENAKLEEFGPWHYATTTAEDLPRVRGETWRGMETLLAQGKTRSIGVSNFTIQHLETLRKTAKVWPPAINQVECHPLYPNNALLEYCAEHGIILQAYSALGGQDASKRVWKEIVFKDEDNPDTTLLECPTVREIADEVQKTPGQVLLRYAIQRNCAIAMKTTRPVRMEENAAIFDFTLTPKQMSALDKLERPNNEGRLCWKREPLRMLDFD